jgi:hypothetical protein
MIKDILVFCIIFFPIVSLYFLFRKKRNISCTKNFSVNDISTFLDKLKVLANNRKWKQYTIGKNQIVYATNISMLSFGEYVEISWLIEENIKVTVNSRMKFNYALFDNGINKKNIALIVGIL